MRKGSNGLARSHSSKSSGRVAGFLPLPAILTDAPLVPRGHARSSRVRPGHAEADRVELRGRPQSGTARGPKLGGLVKEAPAPQQAVLAVAHFCCEHDFAVLYRPRRAAPAVDDPPLVTPLHGVAVDVEQPRV